MTDPDYPDFRALCAELLRALEYEGYAHWVITPDVDPLCQRARAALDQPVAPTLTEQALNILAAAGGPDFPQQMTVLNTDQHVIIKRALEALPND